MKHMHWIAIPVAFVGRIMIALLFIVAGVNKFSNLAGTDAYIDSHGLPAGLALPTAGFELIGGILLLIGLFTRPLALLFAGFTLATILFFHREFTDPMQATLALKNVAIAGGLMILFAYSNIAYSFDNIRQKRKTDRQIANAEIRAAKAEGRAEAYGETHNETTNPD